MDHLEAYGQSSHLSANSHKSGTKKPPSSVSGALLRGLYMIVLRALAKNLARAATRVELLKNLRKSMMKAVKLIFSPFVGFTHLAWWK